MADCHNEFQDFHHDIRILQTKKTRMMSAKNALRDKIKKYFEEKHPEYVPKFYIQGSYKQGTGIRNQDDTCDLDDGVYFGKEPDVTGTTLQSWVYKAVEGHTDGGQEHRKKCIRVVYASDFHIDIPVYYLTEDMEHPKLAVKDAEYEVSDPKEFVLWFLERKKDNEQIVRIVKYLKAWCDNRNNKMLSGLCMTVLAANSGYCKSDKDDKSLYETLKKIKETLETLWYCEMPATPKDNLLDKYDDTQKENFLTAIAEFVGDAETALSEESKEQACKLWRKHLGSRFPEVKDESTDQNEKAAKVLSGIGGVSRPWSK